MKSELPETRLTSGAGKIKTEGSFISDNNF